MTATVPAMSHVEFCTRCGTDTAHTVSIDIRATGGSDENAAFSREPHRVTECERCGATAATRASES